MLRDADERIFGGSPRPESRHAVIDAVLPYVEAQCAAGVPLHHMTRHMIGLFNGLPGARGWRRHLSENACRKGAGPEILLAAAGLVEAAQEAA
jgi:tRNA-dihydrouridine synthase A